MKYLILSLILIIPPFCFSQETDSLVAVQDSVRYKVLDETNEITILTEEFIIEPNDADTTYFSIGGRDISIIEDEEDTEVQIKNRNKWDEEEGVSYLSPNFKNKFRGHWAGFEFGLNNYVDANFSLAKIPENEFMDLNTSRSWNLNLNFAQYSIGFNSQKIGMLTGLGIEWSNYHFSNDSSIQKQDGTIAARELPYTPTKNRLQTGYLTIPILFEFQFTNAKRNHRPHVAIGVIGGIKLFSNTRYHYSDGNNNRKEKIRDDFYLSPLRYGFTARAGYRLVKVYFNYYMTPLFIPDRGPELYPIAFGLALSF